MRRATTTLGVLAIVGLAGVSVATNGSGTTPPRGPEFGATKLSSEIVTLFGDEDVDEFAQPLVAGEQLLVSVAAGKLSDLLPRLTLVDPDGATVPLTSKLVKGGRGEKAKPFRVDRSGVWGVRVSGADGSQGTYQARFKIKAPPRLKLKKQRLGGEQPLTIEQPFEAVAGAIVTATVKSSKKGKVVRVLGVLDPQGNSVAGDATAIFTKGTKSSIRTLELGHGHGTYALLLGIADGEAEYSVDIRVSPPSTRPKGKVTVDSVEPFLLPATPPLEGRVDEVVLIPARQIRALPRPRVFFDNVEATLSAVVNQGTGLDVIPPDFPPDTIVSVTVVQDDGQSACRAGLFKYLAPLEPDPDPDPDPVVAEMQDISPGIVALEGGATQSFRIELSRAAPMGGSVVALSATNGIGNIAPTVTIPVGISAVNILFTSNDVNATGNVVATLGKSVQSTVTVTKKVVVDPPDTIDVSGWTVRQAASSRDYTIPNSITLNEGDYVIVCRGATKTDFETFWGVTLGSNVHYFTSTSPELPTINGAETYTLLGDNVTQDGPTIAMGGSARQNLQRAPGTAAGTAGSWTVQSDAVSNATPGTGQTTGSNNGVYISEFSDAGGSGNFVYEFVELYFDGLLPE